MHIVEAHYLPFVFLYGMPMFGVLAGLLIAGGVGAVYLVPNSFSFGGWLAAVLLIVFALLGRRSVLLEERG